jgi:CDP-diacylglycerol--glycerol-3-phosphate 3-phosphatidyltransferase
VASIPWLLVAIRAFLAPLLLVALEADLLTDRWVLAAYAVAFVTDYFDGAIARRLGVATPRLRQADGAADTLFHLVLAWVTWRLHEGELRANGAALLVCLGSAALWYGLDAFRWRKPAGFHAWSAKLFSVAVLVWVVLLYGGYPTGCSLLVACTLGTVAHLEGIAISLTLRKHVPDVPSLRHAFRLRRAPTLAESRVAA